jgi:hypothetical protein
MSARVPDLSAKLPYVSARLSGMTAKLPYTKTKKGGIMGNRVRVNISR